VHDGLGEDSDGAVTKGLRNGLAGAGVAGRAQDQDPVQPECLDLLRQLRQDAGAESDAGR
jgi:hypothetical protein